MENLKNNMGKQESKCLCKISAHAKFWKINEVFKNDLP